MELDLQKYGMAILSIYVIMIVVTTYTLYTLTDDLLYQAQAITIEEASKARPVFIRLSITVCITILSGLAILLILLNHKSLEIIYVDKKDKQQSEEENQSNEENENTDKAFDLSSVQQVISDRAKSEEKILAKGLTEICKSLQAGLGAYYTVKKDGDKKVLQMNATYAMPLAESSRPVFEYGEGLIGQVAKEQKPLIIDNIPEGYIKIVSGLGSASPTHALIAPVKYGDELCGVVEIATFTKIDQEHLKAVTSAFEAITDRLYAKEIGDTRFKT